MMRDLRPAWVIAQREVRDQFRDWRIIFPVLILTIVFPSLMNFTARQAIRFVERYGAPVIGNRLVPFLLMVVGFFPISVSLVIALESFVGEKERHSIEPLLSSPLSDLQLYLGKLIAAMAPPLLASYLGIAVYLAGVYRNVGWRPEPLLLAQVLLLTAVQTVLMVSGAVVVSSQTTSVRAANLLASFIIIPMAFLIQGESIIMFWASYDVLWWAILGQAVIAALLVRTGVYHFNREELLGRELDTLNLKWGWGVFREAFTGKARSAGQWYRWEVLPTLRRMAIPAVAMILALALGMWAGAREAGVFVLPPELLRLGRLDQGFIEGLESMRFYSAAGVGGIWLHNLRAVALASLLGVFSFGVLGVLALMLPLALVGYLMGNLASAGMAPLAFLTAFVLPHGLLEVPAIVLSGAAIMSLGAALISPAQGQTIGEAWLHALAGWAKIVLGVVVPLLLGAALLEVFVTPQFAVWFLNR